MWIGWGLICWSKIPHGLPTISEIEVNLHQDFVVSAHSDFFQRQMDRSLIYWPNLSGENLLSK